MKLPEFSNGVLPPGDYEMTFAQLKKSSLVVGTKKDKSENWDSAWRLTLVENLELMVNQLWKVGVTEIFIDGSFVEDKDHPNDIDGYFECEIEDLANGKLARELNLLDKHKVWTWDPDSRKSYPGYPKKQLPMWHKYRVELYPHYGQGTGIIDKHGFELTFPSAFRISRREDKPKGIVKIKK